MVRAFKMASELDLHPYAASPSPYKDLDELIKKDLEGLKKRIKGKKDAFSFLLLSFVEKKDLTNFNDYNLTQKFISDLLSSVVNKTAFNFYKKKAEKIVGVLDQKITNKSFKKSTVQKEIIENDSHEKNISTNEKAYLQTILLQNNIKIPENHNPDVFISKEVKAVLEYISKNPGHNRSQIFKKTDPELIEELIFASSKVTGSTETDIEKDLQEIYEKIKKESLERQKKKLSVKIAIAEEKGDSKTSKKLLEEYQNLVKS
jgi:hypothetical protein